VEADPRVVMSYEEVSEAEKEKRICFGLQGGHGVGRWLSGDESEAQPFGLYQIWFLGDKEIR